LRSEVESEVFIFKYSTAGCEEERRERERIKRGVTSGDEDYKKSKDSRNRSVIINLNLLDER
jgi:hypothetical protein